MDHLIRRTILRTYTPLLHLTRNRGKINIQKPRLPHYERAKLWKQCEPIMPKLIEDPIKSCEEDLAMKSLTIMRKDNPYEKIIAREARNWFDSSKMVAIFHLNSMKQNDMFKVEIALKKSNMYIKRYGKKILTYAFHDGYYNAMMPLFQTSNLIVFSPDVQVNKLISLTRRTPQFFLMGGIIDNRLLSKDEFVNYGKLPDLQTSRAVFANLLSSSASGIASQLVQHQTTLLSHLKSHMDVNLNTQTDTEKNNEKN